MKTNLLLMALALVACLVLAVLAAVSHPHSTHQFHIGEFALEPSKIFLGGSSSHPLPPAILPSGQRLAS